MSSTLSTVKEGQLTEEVLAALRRDFYADDKNRLAQNVCTRSDPLDACLQRRCLENSGHVFNHKVEAEGKPVSNQKSSGRCWLFACLNVARLPFAKQYNLEEFEFSQGHLFYWDKVERANYFLHNIGATSDPSEAVSHQQGTKRLAGSIAEIGPMQEKRIKTIPNSGNDFVYYR